MKLLIKIVFIFIIAFWERYSYAQFSGKEQYQLDSLFSITKDSKAHDTSVARAYVSLSNILYASDIDTTLVLCEKAKEIVEIGLANNPSKRIKTNFLFTLSEALNNMGYVYEMHGDIPLALDYYYESLRIDEELGQKEGVAISLINIGDIYKLQGDTKKALEYFMRGLNLFKELKNYSGIASSFINIATIYSLNGNMDEDINKEESLRLGEIKALAYLDSALIINQKLNDKNGISAVLTNSASIYVRQGNISKAQDYFRRSLILQEETGNQIKVSLILKKLGRIMLDKGEVQIAYEYAQRSFYKAQKIESPMVIGGAAKLLSDIYVKQGKGLEGLEMYKLYVQMKDSINNRATQKSIAREQAKYEYEKQKALDDVEHEKILALEHKEQQKQKILKIAAFVGLCLVVLFLIFVFNRLRITKNQKLIIEEKNQEILDSITYAKRIQNAILPAPSSFNKYLPESFVIYSPKDVVAGDFYWLEQIGGATLFAVADCTGHGVPGAMVSVVCHNAMNRAVREFGLHKPGEILDKIRLMVSSEFEQSDDDVQDGMDIALCNITVSQKGDTVLQYAGAHNPLIIIRKLTDSEGYEILETKADKQPIGKFHNPQPFTTHTLNLQIGDALYIFSDGYVDQFGGEKDKKFGSKRFRKLLLSVQTKSMKEQKDILQTTFTNWMNKSNAEQVDDVCIMGVKIK